jgi:alpha-mannosidase
MLHDTPFQQFLLPRLVKARERLAAAIWRHDPSPLAVGQTVPSRDHRTLAEVDGDEFRPVTQLPHYWDGLFGQCWWELAVPPAEDDTPRYLLWRDRAEATLYVDGVPHYGIDPGHHYAPLPASFDRLVIESLCARTGVWVQGETQGLDPTLGSRFDGAFLARRDDEAWHAWHDLDVLMQIAERMQRPEYPAGHELWGRGGWRPELTVAEPQLRQLIQRMSGAVDALDAEGVPACRAALRRVYDDFDQAEPGMDVVLTGHAHIDLVWLWPERAGEFKAVHSFANQLRMMENYPEVVFGYSQPASYEAVQRRSPELMQRVRQQIDAGRWEPTGALYVESDVQLPCGEALVRAFELGQAGFRDLRGEDSRCVWIPDVFGYSAALPTIMAGFGVPYFYTTKLHWSGATRFPYSSFRWTGMDGSEVVSHISWSHYNNWVTPGEVKDFAVKHRQAAVHDEALLACGYGDGGGGLTESMCERARRMQSVASLPAVRWGKIEDFFDRLAEKSDALPVWQGEMYLEYHRGVQTTHSDLKAAFRAAERGLQVWEAVRCATGGGPIDERPWKRVCFAQFHDYIPGSSIQEVYDEAVPELEQIAADTHAAAQRELDATAGGEGDGAAECVFNPLPIARRAWLDRRLVELPPLAGVELAGLTDIDAPAVEAQPTTLDNGRVRASFNAAGEVAELSVDGRAVRLSGSGAQLWSFPDRPATYDAWDIDRYNLSQGTHHAEASAGRAEVIDGVGRVSFDKPLGEVGRATVHYLLEPGSATLGVEIELEMRQTQALVKLVCPTGYRGREARYGGPFGSVARPQWRGPLSNDAMYENPGSRWALVADDTQADGLMLITQSKYGFGACDGLLHCSLARTCAVTPTQASGGTTDIDTSKQPENYADLGTQTIRLALGHYRADAPRPEQPAALADTLFTPPLRYAGRPIDAGLRGIDGPPSLVPAWAKPDADGRWTLRLHETLGAAGTLKLRVDEQRRTEAVDLRGQAVESDTPADAVKPYALLSVAVRCH